jgi:phosphotransacetylase
VLAFLGFRHAKHSETARVADATAIVDTKAPATASV